MRIVKKSLERKVMMTIILKKTWMRTMKDLHSCKKTELLSTVIPSSWILLDSQLTLDVLSNKKLLTNMKDAKWTLTLYCNTGKAIVSQKGDLKGYGTVWFYPDGIANILSVCNVEK